MENDRVRGGQRKHGWSVLGTQVMNKDPNSEEIGLKWKCGFML